MTTRWLFIATIVTLTACAPKVEDKDRKINNDAVRDSTAAQPLAQTYGNDRFKEVTVQRLGDSLFRISGKAQVFEAAFGWVIEDGHNELQKGFQMTDAGAPEWGNFIFTVNATKARDNSTLHLILFESSAEDGSRQHELPVLLY